MALRSPPRLEEIEPRILYSADHPAGLAMAAMFDGDALHRTVQGPAAASHAPAEIVFIESNVDGANQLAADVAAQAAAGRPIEAIVLDSHGDGIAQITRALAGRHDLSAIHIISHGADATLQLGSSTLDSATLLARAGEVAGWGSHLAAGGDLLLYGCDVAADGDGGAFVQGLAHLTGADVAASTDRTGSSLLGGNWVLEDRTGSIEASGAIDAAGRAAFDGLLAANTAPTLNHIGTGIVTTTVVSGSNDYARAVVQQPDGKYLVAGQAIVSSNLAMTIVRYNADGTLDTTFGSGGTLISAFASGDNVANSIALQSDGKFVVAGYVDNGSNNDIAVARYTSAGALDTTFGSGGKVTVAVGSSDDQASVVRLQSDGKIVVGGSTKVSGVSNMTVVRLTSTGALDTTFGTGGKVTTAASTVNSAIYDLQIQSDGKIVATGVAYASGAFQVGLVRYTSAGVLDSTFGSGGKVTTLIGSGSSTGSYAGNALTVLADGSILVGASATISATNDIAAIKYTSSGALDSTFGSGGIVTTDIAGGSDAATGIAVQSSGKIVVTGFGTVSGSTRFAAVRYTASGVLDTSFGSSGKVITQVGTGSGSGAYGLWLGSDDRLVLAGSGNSGADFGVARYTANGVLDTSFGTGVGPFGAIASYTEDGSAVVLDPGATLSDAELNTAGNYAGATLTLARTGGANAEDVFSASGLLGTLTQGGNLTYNGTIVGTVTTDGGGTLQLTFNANATQTLVNDVARAIAYADTSQAPPASVQMTWTLNDGNTGAQGTGGALGASGTTTIDITAVNDAPVLAGTSNFTGIALTDANGSGQTVASLANVTDADGSGLPYGIAISTIASGSGTWQYSIDGGSTWTAIGTVSSTSALLLSSTDRIRFVPGSSATTAQITFRAWDQTSGTHGTKVSTASNDGTTAFSGATGTSSITASSPDTAPRFSIAGGSSSSVTTGFGSSDSYGRAITVQPDGKVVVVGEVDASTYKFGIVRYNADGTLDTSFGGTGSVSIAVTSGLSSAYAVVVQADGKIVVAGASNNDFALVRYNSDGTLDTAFGSGGKVTTDFLGGSDQVSGLALQSDGKIVAVGEALNGSTYDFAVARYNTNGTLDTTFNSTGKLTIAMASGADDYAAGVAIQSDGKIVVGGTASNGGQNDFAAVRLTTAGAIDTTYGSSGKVFVNVGSSSSNDVAGGVVMQTDGKLLIGGTSGSDFGLIRLTTAGALDTTFNSTGKVVTNMGGTETGAGLALQSDGKIVLAGTMLNGSSIDEFAIARYNPNGTLDTTFNGTGKNTVQPGGTLEDDVGSGVAVAPSGAIYLVGTTNNSGDDFAIAGFDPVTGALAKLGSTSTLNNTVSYTQHGSAVVLAPSVSVSDTELDAAGNYAGATITLARQGGADASDVYAATGVLGALTEGASLVYNGTTIGTVTTNSGGTLVLTFNSNATNARVAAALRLIAYSNSSAAPPASAVMLWTINDGNTGSQGAGGALTGTGTTTVNITAVPNTAPVLTPIVPTLATITEDQTSNSGQTVAAIVGSSISDSDSGASQGIAITATSSGNGTWQYSIDGGTTWTAVAAVSGTSALLLRSTDLVRFVPDGQNGTSGSITYRAWDQTSGSAGTKVDASTNGGSTAFSTATDTASIAVSSVNDAPVLTPVAPTLTSITEDQTGNSGQTVASFVGASISDVDSGAVQGIAITATSNGNGTWQYSTDAGSTWTAIGTVSGSAALVLRSSDLVRYVPNGQNGTSGSITYRAWDQSSGSAGGKADASTNGGTTAFSTATDTASITVSSVNDAPVLTPVAPTLTTITEDQASNGGQTVASFVGSSITDVDSGAVQGIAITATSNGNGAWQYSTDGGSTWTAVGTVSGSSALLLRPTDLVRFVPNGQNGTSGSIAYRAWDQTSGSAGSKVDTSTNGGTTAFSSATDTASITVSPVNDAPVLTPITPTLTSITEDQTGNGGQTVASIVGSSITDIDSGAVQGIAITASVNGSGTWQYSIDGGTTWTAVGTVSGSSALLLRATDLVRFVPNGQNGTSGSITYRAWDQSNGSAGGKVDVSTNGGTTAFSTATDTASISVSSVNDAPVLTPAAPTLTTITEDQTGNGGQTVASIVGSSISDVDSGAVQGIAITASVNGNGTWQYSIDGGTTWTAVGTVSGSSALLLRSTDLVRFVPDGQNGTTASIGYRAWDQTSGSAGAKVDVSTNGGTTAFSSATDTASITVTSVNDAPVLTPIAPALASVNEDQTSNGGQTVASIVGSSISDVDSGEVQGIAITATSNGNGAWQYSVDGGSTWNAIGTVSGTSALLLRATDLVRFVPDGQNGTSGSITYRAWDQSSGSAGSKVDVSTNGGTAAFSSATDTASISVSSVNDAPVLTPVAPTLTSINEDQTTNGGQTVASIVGSSIADVDSGAVQGIAITTTVNGNGTWQYSIDGGSTWTAIGPVSGTSALLLRSTDLVRFVPDGQNGTTASLSYRAWDQTSGSAGAKVDASTNGGTTAFSTATDTASITVTSVNDAPVLTPIAPTLATITEDQTGNSGQTVASFVGASITDVDSGAVQGIAITATSNGNGAWQYSTDGGSTWTAIGTVSDTSALLLRTSDLVRFVPDGQNGTTATLSYRAWDQTGGSVGSKVSTASNGGTTAFSTATDTATLTATSVNDAPVLAAAAPVLTAITEDQTTNGGQTVASIVGTTISDVDSGAVQGIAITGLTSGNGNWQYSIDGGSTWTAIGTVSGSSALLLRSTDLVRFVPDGQNGTSGSITYRAWDQTSGSAGTKVDASTNGGTTAFSTTTDTASIAVSSINDAPVLTPTAPTLTTITEDQTSNSGQTVASIVGSSITDVDSGAMQGMAITTTSNGNGAWQYSTDGGSTWTAIGTVSGSSALLLRSTDLVRFVPDGQNGTTGSIGYRAWDQTSGNAGTKVDTSTNGGTTAFSNATDTASITVSSVNDAPVLTPIAPTLASITEDQTGNGGQTVASLIGASISDVDSGAVQGIAITTTVNGSGTWQYSIDGGTTWTAIGTVSSTSALLLRASDLVRFVPDGRNGTTGSISYRAWDQASGGAGSKVDASTNGGTTAFSTASDTASISVSSVNDAPVLTPVAPTLTTITEDQTTNSGQTVASIVGSSITDVDSGAVQGIAITATSNGNGSWQYSVDGGSTWTAIGTVSGSSALLLRSTDLVRFVPDGRNGTTASIGYRAWDQTGGSAGSKVDTSTNGGTTAFSSATDTASITVTAVNDAPVLTPASPTLTSITEDQTNNGGQTVASIVGSSIGDVDSGAVQGIAITATSNGNGSWQYSIDGGSTWAAVGTVGDGSALLLRSTDLVRFVPNGQNGTSGSITYRAWDQSSGSAGSKVDVSTNGGTTAFSGATDTASISVSSVNDAPVLMPIAPTLTSINEDQTGNSGQTVASIVGSSIADVDSGAVQGIAVTTTVNGNGTWQYSIDGGSTWTAIGPVSGTSALLLRSTDLVRFVPDGQNGTTASLSYRAWDQTGGSAGAKVDASTNGGTTAFSAATDTASITVTSVNDAPVLTPAAPTLPTITEDQTATAGRTVAAILGTSVNDVDSGALQGIAITGTTATDGVWQYSLDGGTTWNAIGSVSGTGALLLRATDLVRFVPDARNGGSATLSWRAWDQTSDSAGTLADTSANGGTTAFSAATDTVTQTVTSVNDAPVLTPAAPSLTPIADGDIHNPGQTVASFIGGSISDVDDGAVAGIAITAQSPGNGTWQYSLDGGSTWIDVGSVGGTSALLLRDTDRMRLVPDGANATTATLTYVAWDQTSGSAGTKADASSGGGTSAFSTASDTAILQVDFVNHAPVLTPAAPTLTTITEDATANAGQTVASVIGGSITDSDSFDAIGIAITATANGNGSWQYSIDGGSTWSAVGSVSDASALLLRATDLIRFVPNGQNGTSASFTYRGWDETSGAAGAKVDASSNGGNAAFSAATDTASIAVSSVNDAPVLTPVAPALSTIDEDATANAGQTVASFVGSSIADVDSGALQGIAITAAANGNGSWQYSLDGGTTWNAVGTVSDTAAVLLRSTDLIRFVPDGKNGTTASIRYQAWDRTAGSAGSHADASINGGTMAVSSASDTASIAVSSVNDAPVLTPAAPALATITEDQTANAGQTVASFVGASITDVDSGALPGIAITATSNGNGTWQYSIDGGTTWTAVGTVSGTSALLLRSTDLVRFVPDGQNGTTASLSYRAWDRTSGSAGAKVDASTNGGTTALSTAADTASITVSSVNDAPVLTPAAPTLTSITEDQTNNGGQTVASIVGSSIGDVDSGAVLGIAITATVNGNGTWQYSIDGGTTWTAIGTVSGSSALLLRSTDLVRLVPDGQNGTAASISYRAWDQTSGSAGSKVDVSTNGGTTAFSTATDTASIAVSPVNDAPVLTPIAPTLPTITEDQTNNAGQTVASIVGSSIGDIDSGALQGIAITATANGNGTWQYSLDGGSTWTAVGTVSGSSALLLRSTDLVRFVPDGRNGTTASISYEAWDRSSGSAGSKVDASLRGGTSAFSTAGDTASITVTSVNDSPVLTPIAPTLATITEDQTTNGGQTVASFVGSSIADVDHGALQGIAITATADGNGTWQYSLDGGTTWNDVGPVSGTSALLLRSTDLVRFVPDGRNGTAASIGYAAWDRSSGSAGSKVDASLRGGTSAFSTAGDTASITVTSVNDAPVLTPRAPTLTSITEDQTTNADQTVASFIGGSISDVDSGAVQGIAITAAANGNGGWQYSLDGGTTWQTVGAVSDSSALLLRATDLVRFVPDGRNGTAASLSYVAWDQSTGTAGARADTALRGGSNAFSTAADGASIEVTPVNDAPVLTPHAPTLASNAAQTVASFIRGSISDVDAGAVQGIAITAANGSHGNWQYSLDGGTTWTAIGTVGDDASLLLRATDLVRFVPDGSGNADATLTYRAWDQTTGQAGERADTRLHGDTSAYSAASDRASVHAAIHTAPVLTPHAPALAPITEDQTGNGGQPVASFISGSITTDAGTATGIAITATADGNGRWQYSLDGGRTWNAIGTVAENAALLLRSTDLVRFVPDGDNGTSASLTYRAWDETHGSAGARADVRINGGSSAYSAAEDSASIAVSSVNDAPVLTPAAPTLSRITEDQIANGGQTVASFIGASITDVDRGALQGIAITSADASNGRWEYSTDGGTTWNAVGAVSEHDALLLRAGDLIRFVPDGKNGTTASIGYRAWDQNSGIAGRKADPHGGGATSAFSSTTDRAQLVVASVNDAPVLHPSSPQLAGLTEAQTGDAGQSIASFIGASISDVDDGALRGIAIEATVAGQGVWQYSIDGGHSWHDIGTVDRQSALLLRATDLVRFVPNGVEISPVAIDYRAWDQTQGTAGQHADADAAGATSAFSTTSDQAWLQVGAAPAQPPTPPGPTPAPPAPAPAPAPGPAPASGPAPAPQSAPPPSRPTSPPPPVGPAPSPGRVPDAVAPLQGAVQIQIHVAADEATTHHARSLEADDAARPTTLAMLLDALAAQQGGSRGAHDTVPEAPRVEIPAEAQAATQETELQVALATGLAASVGLLVWAGRGSALLTSLLISTPAWRGYDLLPVLRRRDENRDWHLEADAARSDERSPGEEEDDDIDSAPPVHAANRAFTTQIDP